jgi:hypothetical protein
MKTGSVRRFEFLFLVFLFAGFFVANGAGKANWWSPRGILNGLTRNDYAAANQGQVKWMATNAFIHMNATLAGGAGTGVAAIVQDFSLQNNYYPATLGQLKRTAEPFWARMIAAGQTNSYPWTTGTTADDSDYSPATVGHVKRAFSFNID